MISDYASQMQVRLPNQRKRQK